MHTCNGYESPNKHTISWRSVFEFQFIRHGKIRSILICHCISYRENDIMRDKTWIKSKQNINSWSECGLNMEFTCKSEKCKYSCVQYESRKFLYYTCFFKKFREFQYQACQKQEHWDIWAKRVKDRPNKDYLGRADKESLDFATQWTYDIKDSWIEKKDQM